MYNKVMAIQLTICAIVGILFVFMFDSLSFCINPCIITSIYGEPSIWLKFLLGALFAFCMSIFTTPMILLVLTVLKH